MPGPLPFEDMIGLIQDTLSDIQEEHQTKVEGLEKKIDNLEHEWDSAEREVQHLTDELETIRSPDSAESQAMADRLILLRMLGMSEHEWQFVRHRHE